MCESMRTLMKDDIVKAQEDGVKEGEMKKARETAFELANRNIPAETIADIIKVSLETVEKWLSGNVGVVNQQEN